MDNISIDTVVPNGEVAVHRIIKDSVAIGSVVICVYDDYIEALYIFVEPKHRSKGYAQKLVKYLQENYDYIVTGWHSSETAGRELFLKMGFKLRKKMFKGRTTNLEWKKL